MGNYSPGGPVYMHGLSVTLAKSANEPWLGFSQLNHNKTLTKEHWSATVHITECGYDHVNDWDDIRTSALKLRKPTLSNPQWVLQTHVAYQFRKFDVFRAAVLHTIVFKCMVICIIVTFDQSGPEGIFFFSPHSTECLWLFTPFYATQYPFGPIYYIHTL